MKKRPWHLWLIVLFVGFMYLMGIYDFFMMLSHNKDYYAVHHYGQAVVEYFTNYPAYYMMFWIANLLAGILAPITLIFNAKCAKWLALISWVADLILLLFTFTFRNRLAVLGAGAHSMKQEEINQLLVELAEKGRKVVRLKGGDPFVFGRGGEEILALKKADIPYEV